MNNWKKLREETTKKLVVVDNHEAHVKIIKNTLLAKYNKMINDKTKFNKFQTELNGYIDDIANVTKFITNEWKTNPFQYQYEVWDINSMFKEEYSPSEICHVLHSVFPRKSKSISDGICISYDIIVNEITWTLNYSF